MKGFFKILLVLIFVAALAGCGFFGYHYFKKDSKGGNLTLADAKEMVYTTLYDMGQINSTTFKTAMDKDPIVKPTNFMLDVNDNCHNTYFNTYGTEEYQTYTDNTIYVVGINTFLLEGSAYSDGFMMNPGFKHARVIIELFSHPVEEDVYYVITMNNETFKATYNINGNKLVCKTYDETQNTECVYEFTMNNKTENGITEYYALVRCNRKINETTHTAAICKFEVGYTNGNKTVNRFVNVQTGSWWKTSFDCDVVNDKILYSKNTDTMDAKITENVNAYCQENAAAYYSNINALDLPSA